MFCICGYLGSRKLSGLRITSAMWNQHEITRLSLRYKTLNSNMSSLAWEMIAHTFLPAFFAMWPALSLIAASGFSHACPGLYRPVRQHRQLHAASIPAGSSKTMGQWGEK
eukprot:5658071-Amphidinium_carterae.1